MFFIKVSEKSIGNTTAFFVIPQVNAIGTLNRDDTDLQYKLSEIFGVKDSVADSTVGISAIEQRNKKIFILRQYASDENVLNHPEQVALNQEDLDKLIEDDKLTDIYLCNNSFVIKLIKRKHYIGIGKVKAVVKNAEGFNFEGVSFSNVSLDAQSILNIGCVYHWYSKETPEDFFNAMEWYKKAADKGNVYATYCIGILYYNGNGVQKDGYKALEWFSAPMYRNGEGIPRDCYKALEWFKKAANRCYCRI